MFIRPSVVREQSLLDLLHPLLIGGLGYLVLFEFLGESEFGAVVLLFVLFDLPLDLPPDHRVVLDVLSLGVVLLVHLVLSLLRLLLYLLLLF